MLGNARSAQQTALLTLYFQLKVNKKLLSKCYCTCSDGSVFGLFLGMYKSTASPRSAKMGRCYSTGRGHWGKLPPLPEEPVASTSDGPSSRLGGDSIGGKQLKGAGLHCALTFISPAALYNTMQPLCDPLQLCNQWETLCMAVLSITAEPVGKRTIICCYLRLHWTLTLVIRKSIHSPWAVSGFFRPQPQTVRHFISILCGNKVIHDVQNVLNSVVCFLLWTP